MLCGMSMVSERYRRLSDQFAVRITAVPDDKWDSQSPCENWTARDVVKHVVNSQGYFLTLVGREMVPLQDVTEDPSGAWDKARAVVQADLDDPQRAGAEFDGLFGRTSLEQAIDRMVNFDLVVHGWDLARATGQDDYIEPEEARRVLADAKAMGDALRSPNACGPEVEASPDADDQTKMLAYLGRKA